MGNAYPLWSAALAYAITYFLFMFDKSFLKCSVSIYPVLDCIQPVDWLVFFGHCRAMSSMFDLTISYNEFHF